MTAQQQRTIRDIKAQLETRDRQADAAREAAVARGELATLIEATLDRAGELALLGRRAESKRVIALNLGWYPGG